MNNKKLKVLLIIEQCNPEWSSVPLEGYKYYQEISQLVDATLVTHERNEQALSKVLGNNKVIYVRESAFSKKYHNLVASLTYLGKTKWPLYNALSYLVYAEFNRKVYEQFKTQISNRDYDIVHVLTPMMPRYPAKVVNACEHTPFLLGPVNGGVPFPKGFQKVARQEFAQFNFLRVIGRVVIPGYAETYRKADKILAGSTYTLNYLKNLFSLSDQRISLFYENGISKDFFGEIKKNKHNHTINLLFVGRLVPYKGADMLIEAISKCSQKMQAKVRLIIVGDGSEKSNLETKVRELNLNNIVKFTGWVKQQETLEYYKKSDVFCFPSVREFGGAVVLEAMACGLPCIVVNNGGIGEYVTEKTGFKIEPISRTYVIEELTNRINNLVLDDNLRLQMSNNSVERVKEFEWGYKAEKIVEIYSEMINRK
ncbi:MAG: glycosyltransferase family 4 protein [Rivularia sp. T60_A2020_040]|nr:glycosyltransferase family 4 protein [Rivularia sp. T60_A2020_040]